MGNDLEKALEKTVEPSPEIAEKLSQALSTLCENHPFFAGGLLRLKICFTPLVPTAGTNGEYLLFNPELVNKLSHAELIGTVAHEIMHLYLRHHLRQGSRFLIPWNVAADVAINEMLMKMGFILPKGVCTIDSVPWKVESEHLPRSLIQDPTAEEAYDWLDFQLVNIWDIVAPGKGDPEGQETKWKAAMQEGLAKARQIGELPGDVEAKLESSLKKGISLRSALARFMDEVSKTAYSWEKPNKSMVRYGFYAPSLYSKVVPELVIAVDTSGSMSQENLNKGATVIKQNLEHFPVARTILLYCDVRISKVQVFNQEDEIKFESFKGRGGTDFRPIFAYIKRNHLQPALLIYFTDLMGKFPPGKPHYPVIWVTPEKAGQAPFGTVVTL